MKRTGLNGTARLLASTVILTGIITGPAQAQAESAALPLSEDSGEIVVTAQKRSQRLQDVPMSIAAITGADLEHRGLVSLEDYARFIPGVSTIGSGARASVIPVIRGVQLGDQAPATALYIDELPVQPLEFERTGVPDPNVHDIARVEVLKGPQGSIYGGNSLGGLVKIIPNAPDFSGLDANAAVRISQPKGGDTSYAVRGMMNLPIVSERLAVRIVGAYDFEGGVVDAVPYDLIRTTLPTSGPVPISPEAALDSLKSAGSRNVDDTRVQSLRASLAWRPDDAFTVTGTYFHQAITQNRTARVSNRLFDFGKALITPDNGVPDARDISFDIGTIKLQAALEWADITSTTGYYRLGWSDRGDVSALVQNVLDGFVVPTVPRPIIVPAVLRNDGTERQWAHEARIATRFEFPLNAVAGFYYRDVKQVFDQFIINPAYIPLIGTSVMFSKDDEYDRLKEYALFGQATLKVSDALVLEAGARWYHYTRDQNAVASGIFGFAPRIFKGKDNVISPSASATYAFSSNHNVYVRAASGFRPGFGFNTGLLPDSCSAELSELGITRGDAQVGPDKVWNYEIGTKNLFLDKRVRFNASIYRIDWTDLQNSINLDCGFAVRANVGSARIDGAEFELGVQATDTLGFTMSGAHTDARIHEADPRQAGVVSGARIPASPRWTFNLAADWRATVGDDRDIYATAAYTYSSSYFYDFAVTDARRRRGALGLLDARLGLNWAGWDVSLFGKNITNVVKKGNCAPAIGGISGVLADDYTSCVNRPRTVGLELKHQF